MIDPILRKEIVRNLHSAIDSEMLNEDDRAYSFYVEGLRLVAEVLKNDTGTKLLSNKDKWNLIEFAKQSVARVCIIVKKEDLPPGLECEQPSAPFEPEIHTPPPPPILPISLNSYGADDQMMMARYQRRLGLATSAVEKQNLELELARHLVEKAAVARTRLMQSTAWAMQNAHKKFRIQEKLVSGRLKESDFRKQQLFALSLQFNEGNTWLVQLGHDLTLYPNNEKLVRELLENVLTDNAHPIKATLNQMQEKVTAMIRAHELSCAKEDVTACKSAFTAISEIIKEDLAIIQDVLRALFEPLTTTRNSIIASDILYHVYFSQIKQNIIAFIRLGLKDVERKLAAAMARGYHSELAEYTEKEAVTKLHYLTTLHNPYSMLDCTVHIVKLLATSKFEREHTTSIGADDLLPRLCQVLASSSIPAISAEALFMETFMPNEKALGEEGYAVTMLQSAIAHLTS